MSDKQTEKNVTVERIRKLIDESGLTREVIASKLGLDTSTITKYYNGNRNLTIDALKKFAVYFDVSTDYLLGLTEVQTVKQDVRYICDLLKIDEEIIYVLSDSVFMENDLGESIIFNVDYNGYCGLFRYVDEWIDMRNKVIKSDGFKQWVCSATICKVILEIAHLLAKLNDEDINNLGKNKVKCLIEFCRRWDREYKYQLFSAQNSINDFIKGCAPIQNKGFDDKLHAVLLKLELKYGDENVND